MQSVWTVSIWGEYLMIVMPLPAFKVSVPACVAASEYKWDIKLFLMNWAFAV